MTNIVDTNLLYFTDACTSIIVYNLIVIFFGWFWPQNKASSQCQKHIKNSQKCVKNSQLAGLLFSTKQNNELTNDNLENLIDIFEGIKRRKLKLCHEYNY